MLAWLLTLGGLALLAFGAAWWLRRRGREVDDPGEDQPFEPPLVNVHQPGGLG
jgi:hypothetical protein